MTDVFITITLYFDQDLVCSCVSHFNVFFLLHILIMLIHLLTPFRDLPFSQFPLALPQLDSSIKSKAQGS